MDCVKYATTRWERYEGSVRAVARVDDELGATNVYRLEVETGSCVVSKLPEFRIEWLLPGNFFPVYAEVANCCDDAVEVRD